MKRAVLSATILVAAVPLAAGGATAFCVAMPGESFAGPLPPASDSERRMASELRAHVVELAVKIGERRTLHGDSLHRAEAYLQAQLTGAAPNGRLTREPVPAEGDPANLVLDLPGAVMAPIVLVGAHYDTAPGTPGANDDATGVAAAVLLASRLAGAAHALPIRVVLFANEEPPFYRTSGMGSLHHAKRCRQRGDDIRAMFSLETIGYYSDAPRSQDYPTALGRLYPDRGNFIAFVGNLASRRLVRESVGIFRSHARFPPKVRPFPTSSPASAGPTTGPSGNRATRR